MMNNTFIALPDLLVRQNVHTMDVSHDRSIHARRFFICSHPKVFQQVSFKFAYSIVAEFAHLRRCSVTTIGHGIESLAQDQHRI